MLDAVLVGEQFMQDVLEYNPLPAGIAVMQALLGAMLGRGFAHTFGVPSRARGLQMHDARAQQTPATSPLRAWGSATQTAKQICYPRSSWQWIRIRRRPAQRT